MVSNKELYIRTYETLLSEGFEDGMSETEAEDYAEEYVHSEVEDYLADMGDYYHDLARDQRMEEDYA